MGRVRTVLAIWLASFLVGFVVYYLFPFISNVVLQLMPILLSLDSRISGALIMGVISSFITVFAVMLWARSTKPTALI